MPDYNKLLFDIGIELGYFKKGEPEGVCQGVTMAWHIHGITGEKEQYDQLLAKIITKKGPALLDEIAQVKTKIDKQQPLTTEDKEVFQILAFYEQLKLFQDANDFNNIFQKPLSQYDVSAVSKFAASASLEAAGGIPEIYSETGSYNKNEFTAYLNETINAIDSMDYQDGEVISFHLSNVKHAIGWSYDTKNHTINVMDINQGPSRSFGRDGAAHATDMIFSGFGPRILNNKPYQAIHTQLITTEQNSQLKKLQSTFESLKNQHVKTPDLTQKERLTDLVHCAAIAGDDGLLEKLANNGVDLRESSRPTIAAQAAKNGHCEVLRVLANHGVDLNFPFDSGITPVHLAAKLGQAEVINVLAKHGVTGTKLDAQTRESGYLTPACLAVRHGHAEALIALASNGANLNAPSGNGFTPVDIAIQDGNIAMLKLLAQTGANLRLRDPGGRTPAHNVALRKDKQAIEVLVQHDPTLFKEKDSSGMTPVDFFISMGNVDGLKVLEQNGFEPDNIEKYILQAECRAILSKINIDGNLFPGTRKDTEMIKYFNDNIDIVSEADTDTLKRLKEEYHHVLEGLEDMAELRRITQSFRENSQLWTVGMKDKAQNIENAILSTSIHDRMNIDPNNLTNPAHRPILESLAAHRHYLTKPRDILMVSETNEITAIDPAHTFKQFKEYKSKLQEIKNTQNAKPADSLAPEGSEGTFQFELP